MRPWTLFVVFVSVWGLALAALELFDGFDLVVLAGAGAVMCVVALLWVAALVAPLLARRGDGAREAPSARFVLLVAGCLGGALVALAVAYLFAPVPPSAGALEHSVERETGSVGLGGGCSRDRGGRWRCDVADGQGSGSATYVVTVDGWCWRARRVSAGGATETPMPARAAGCTRVQDRYAPLAD